MRRAGGEVELVLGVDLGAAEKVYGFGGGEEVHACFWRWRGVGGLVGGWCDCARWCGSGGEAKGREGV